MRRDEWEGMATALLEDSLPPGAEWVKRSRIRRVATVGDVFIKAFPLHRTAAVREARNLARAAQDGLPVPEVLAGDVRWVAMRRLADPRPPSRADLPELLEIVGRAHAAGWVHGDMHLGNFARSEGKLFMLDWQRARRLRRAPRFLQLRDFGFLAQSLGEPLPEALEFARRARDRRQRYLWRSRSGRCVKESSRFTRWEIEGRPGFRLREVPDADLRASLEGLEASEPLHRSSRTRIWRRGKWVVKRFARIPNARAAWLGGHGLEVRGLRVARPQAWAGHWLWMEDAGQESLEAWFDKDSGLGGARVRQELVTALTELLIRLHCRGVYHRDVRTSNLVWSPGQEPILLDYGPVRFGRRVSARRRIKNLAQINASLPDTIEGGLRERALKDYIERVGAGDAYEPLRDEVVRISLAREHHWSGC